MNWNNLWGYTHVILYFSNIMTNNVIIYLTRHGESEYNVLKKIGGNSNLTDKGLHYSKVLYEYFQNDKIDVYTSNLNRTIQTSQYFHETRAYPELNEINSGICDSKTYDEIKSLYPEEHEKRKVNKYCYSYPKGESYEDIKNRVMPFMKLMFGATFTRVPPKYVLDLNRMGLSYRDFMTSTDTPSLNRNMNREMGYMMNMEMPEYLKTLREEYKDQPDAEQMVANGVKQYISSTKSLLYKFEQTKDDQSGQAALMNKYKRMSPYSRIAAMQQYKKRFGDEEPKEVEDWMELNNMAAQIRTGVKSIIGR